MNQIILFEEDFISGSMALLKGRRLEHLTSIIKIKKGDTLKAGLLNSKQGTAVVLDASEESVLLETGFSEDPPPALPLVLVLAMPRPKSFRKALHYAAAMGVKKFFIIRTWRVEKNYFDSPVLESGALASELILALEQCRDTILPEIKICPLFKPFVEDELPGISSGTLKLAAHPGSDRQCPVNINSPATLVIGPEGGFIDYEINMLENQGFQPVNIGPRILRVENAAASIIGRLYG